MKQAGYTLGVERRASFLIKKNFKYAYKILDEYVLKY